MRNILLPDFKVKEIVEQAKSNQAAPELKRLVVGFPRGGLGYRRVRSCGICGRQSGAGVGFLRVLRFPLPILISPNSASSQSPGAGTVGQK
jgi:hypothetical protein